MAETNVDPRETSDRVIPVTEEGLAQLQERAIEIDKPAPAEAVEYTIGADEVVKLNFPLDDVEIIQTESDIILIFEDQAQISFLSMVASALAEVPPLLLLADGSVITAAELLDLGGDITDVAEGLGELDPAAGAGAEGPAAAFADRLFEDGLQIGDDIPVAFVAGGPLGAEGVPSPVPPPPPTQEDPLPPIPDGILSSPTGGETPDGSPGGSPGGEGPGGGGPGDDFLNTIPEIPPIGQFSLDEAGLVDAATVSVSGDIPVDFSDNGPAASNPLVFTQDGVDALNALDLTSRGDDVTLILSPEGDQIVATAGGNTVFIISITEDEGSFGFTLDQQRALDHADGAGTNILDLPFEVEASDSDGSTTTQNFTVQVIDGVPVVDAIAAEATGLEDNAVPLNLSATLASVEGPDALDVTISGVPGDASLTAGAPTGNPGEWSVPAGDLATVALNPPEHFSGEITLTLTVSGEDSDVDSGSDSQEFTVFVAPVADDIEATFADADAVFEGEAVSPLVGSPGDDVIVGTSDDETLLGGAGDDSLFGNDGEDTLIGDGITAGAYTAPVALSVTTADDDGSEVQSVQISGIPEGAVLTNTAGDVFSSSDSEVLNADQLDGLEISVPQGTADFELALEFRTLDTDPDRGETDLGTRNEVVQITVPEASTSHADFLSGGDGDDLIFGESDGDLTGLLGENAGDDIRAGNGEDEVLGQLGADRIAGGAGNDILSGGEAGDFIMGGTDTGTATPSGTSSITFTALGGDAGFNNTFGYFTMDDDGNPVAGKVVWADAKETADGTSVTVTFDTPDAASKVGLFIVPNGARRNRDLEDDTDVTFQQNGDGDWEVVANGEVLDGNREQAYFSNPDLNPDGEQHFIFGDDGSVVVEDLPVPHANQDFDDVILNVQTRGESFDFVGGDQLWGGDRDAVESDGEHDVFFYSRGDGVDTIHDFEVGTDQLYISGYEQEELSIVQDGEDTIVELGDGGAVKLVGVDADVFGAESNIADYDADTDDDGTLGIDELVQLQDDVLGDGGGADAPPSAGEASIVLVAPTEPGLSDSGGDEPVV